MNHRHHHHTFRRRMLTTFAILLIGGMIGWQFTVAVTRIDPGPATWTVQCWRAHPDTPPLCVKSIERDVP